MLKVCYTELIPELKPFEAYVCSSENCTKFVLRSFSHLDIAAAASTNSQTHINATNFYLLNDFGHLKELKIRLSRLKKGGKTREIIDIVKLRVICELDKLSIDSNNTKDTQRLLKNLSATRVKINRCALTQPAPFTQSREVVRESANFLIRLLGSSMVRPYLNTRVLNLINTTTVISRKYQMRFIRAMLYNKHCGKYVFYGRDSYVPILPQECLPVSLDVTHSDAIKHLVNTESVQQLRELKKLTIVRIQSDFPLMTLTQHLCSLVQLQLLDCAQSSLLSSEILKIINYLPKLAELSCNFKGCRYRTANIDKILFACFEKNLRSISIQEDPIDCLQPFYPLDDYTQSVSINVNISKLSLVDFEGFGLNLANRKLFSLIINAPQVKKLSFVNCYLPNNPFQSLWRLENLEDFRFHGYLSLLENLFERPLVSLKSLELKTPKMNIEQINKIFRFKENYGSLTKIKLNTNTFGPTSDVFWDHLIDKFSNIEELILESSMRCPLLEFIKKFQEKGENLKALKSIWFEGFELNLQALKSFELISIPNLQQITLTNLYFGSFTDYDFPMISTSIKNAWGKRWRLENASYKYSVIDMILKRRKKPYS